MSGLSANESDILVEQKTTNDGRLDMRVIVRKLVEGHKFEVVHIISKDDNPTKWDMNACVRPNGSDLTVLRERNGDYDLREADETESSEDTYDENDNEPGAPGMPMSLHLSGRWAEEENKKRALGFEAHIMSISEDTTHWDFDALTVHSKPRARRNHWDAGPPPADTDAHDKSGDTR